MESFKDDAKRIEWLDIFRGILIILMVIGHSTGLFNKYIYQFHMAAFFFLSGYTFHPKKKSLFHTIFDKFLTILLPTLTTVLFGLVILWLLHLGNWDILFSSWQFPGWGKSLTSLFVYGDIYVDVLGANWFLITLFGVCILSKLIHLLVSRSLIGYLSISTMLYIVGYIIVNQNCVPLPHVGMLTIDLVFIGNMFYALGYLFRECGISAWIAKHSVVHAFCCVAAIICTLMFAQSLQVIVDWPSHRFSNPILNGWSALNGIVLVYTLSLYIERFTVRFGELLRYVGKNTLGILFFHFLFFKIMYLPFYWMGTITIDDLSCITPGRMSTLLLEKKYWFIVAAGALILSLVTWRLLLHSKILSFLLGQNKKAYLNIWNALVSTKAVARFIHIKNILACKIKENLFYVFDSYKKNRLLWLSTALMLVMAAVPLYKQAIICNDELQARLWSMNGFIPFLKHYAIKDYVMKGRALSAIIDPLNMYLGFIGNSNWTYKLIQLLSIFVDAGVFSIFLFKLFGNKQFAGICGLSIIVFLPVTFEHTAPNAFNTLFNIPFLLLLTSLILFINYLVSDQKKWLVVSMLLLFINLLSYESFIMFIPLYWGIALKIIGLPDKKRILKKSIYPTTTALLFIVCYIISGILFKSSYLGNQIGGFTVISSLKIIYQLVLASFPGYYMFIPKYRYLLSQYYNLELENCIRIILVSVLFGGIVYHLLRIETEKPIKKTSFGAVLGIGGLFIILPTGPIAVAQMYQGHVGINEFIALPTTFFTYFAATFVFWYVIWQLARRFRQKMLLTFIALGIACYLFPVQAMNDVFAKQQNQDFQRIQIMESLFSSELITSFDGKEIKSTDLFSTQNALAIHDSYWTEFASNKGQNIQIVNSQGGSEDICLYFDGTQFIIRIQEEICVITTTPQTGYGVCQYAENKHAIIAFENPIVDNGLYEYFYKLSATGELTASEKADFVLELVGNDLQSCIKEYGYYEDGWVAKSSLFQIRTGENGKIDLEIYCPLSDFYNRKVELYVDNKLMDTIELQEPFTTISINTMPSQVISLKLETNFIQEDAVGDTRELAMILLSLQGQ